MTEPVSVTDEAKQAFELRQTGVPISTKFASMTISHQSHGGYTVQETYTFVDRGSVSSVYFACSTLDEALSFVRDNIMENAKPKLSDEAYAKLADVDVYDELTKAAKRNFLPKKFVDQYFA